MTWSAIHTPVTMIGGRLRVLGYVNWAYGHGYDFRDRDYDVERAYNGNISDTFAVLQKYDASYVYVVKEEQKNAPECLQILKEAYELK
jgi:uncharacterized membrane protein